MNTLYCFIAKGRSIDQNAVVLGSDASLPQLLGERYAPAKNYQSVIVSPDEWHYPDVGTISADGRNIDWNALWNAAYDYLVNKRGIASADAKAALEKTASNGIGTFVYLTGKVTFGVPVEISDAVSEPKSKAFALETYYAQPKSMPHMFDRGAAAPVVVKLSFTEAIPTDAQLAEARKRIPAKQKLFGSAFIKKPEDVFGTFINDPFFIMYNKDNVADLRGKAYEATALPLRSVDDAIGKIEKRLPYADVSPVHAQAERFSALLTEALKAANVTATGMPQPKGVYNCYTTTDFRATPVLQDVTRIQAYEYIILGRSMQNGIAYCCYEFEFAFHIIQVGNAYAPVNLLPKFD